MIVDFADAAADDVRQATRYYEAQREGLGLEFVNELELVVERIRTSAQSLALIAEGVRRVRMKRFPYGVYYTMSP
jgi:hypothetical protein